MHIDFVIDLFWDTEFSAETLKLSLMSFKLLSEKLLYIYQE